MPARPPSSRTTVRLVAAVAARLAQDPVARVNVSAFVRVVLDAFVASETPIESTRAIGLRLGGKVEAEPLSLIFPQPALSHLRRYARAYGGHSFASLVSSALTLHYFGRPAPSVSPPAPPCAPLAPEISPARGWRPVLLAFSLGQTHEFRPQDVPTTLRRARRAVFEASDAIRDRFPDFRITTRLTPKVLYVTRMG
jgi:hypothetical protein